jgi:chromosome partitioning protein
MNKHIITVVNQKGGVGKTTSTINVAAYLAANNKKVLIIDLDPQGNATSGLGSLKGSSTIYDVLIGGSKIDNVIAESNIKNLDMISADSSLSAFETESVGLSEREYILKNQLENLSYDYILIDCPPSLGVLTINALTAADQVLIPVQAEYYAMEGLSQLLHTIQAVQERTNSELTILGLFLTMYDKRTSLSQQVKKEIENYFGELVFKTQIPRNIRLAEAPSHGKTIFEYDSWSKGAKMYKSLGKEILGRTNS